MTGPHSPGTNVALGSIVVCSLAVTPLTFFKVPFLFQNYPPTARGYERRTDRRGLNFSLSIHMPVRSWPRKCVAISNLVARLRQGGRNTALAIHGNVPGHDSMSDLVASSSPNCPGCDVPMMPVADESTPLGVRKTVYRCVACKTEVDQISRANTAPTTPIYKIGDSGQSE
jgi:hypothetical protein